MPTSKFLNVAYAPNKPFPHQIDITSLEQDIWDNLKYNTVATLDRLQIEQLYAPTIYILHQLVSDLVTKLHYKVFEQFVAVDFDLGEMGDEALNTLYQNELNEHGDNNIAIFCHNNKLHIRFDFPETGNKIVEIGVPEICGQVSFTSEKLIDTLGYRLETSTTDFGDRYHAIRLIKHEAEQLTLPTPTLFEAPAEQHSLHEIFSKLSYGIVRFTGLGTVETISATILDQLKLNNELPSIELFTQSVPAHFYNDVVWGLALNGSDGLFENYRVRIKILSDSTESILFNVSGYRDQHKIIHTLWQAITFDGKDKQNLSEGSILNEARVHNITRNYVPQLVEQKAREIVKLGGTNLTNEECYIAVLFCDIVGFTPHVEKNKNEKQVIHTLNSIFRRIAKSVKDHHGFIDKFMGDCIMALFRNPSDAVIAALEMQRHSIDINNMRTRAGQETLQLRVGIDWGKVIIGNVGTPERLDWTTIGDVVNTAARIEKSCEPGSVLISQRMHKEIIIHEPEKIRFGDVFQITVKGKQKQLDVCYAIQQ